MNKTKTHSITIDGISKSTKNGLKKIAKEQKMHVNNIYRAAFEHYLEYQLKGKLAKS